jgi:hypothetical protein
MAVKISFQTRYGVSGEYVNFDPQLSDKTKCTLRMKYWKDVETRNTEGMLPFNDRMPGGSNERIAGFNCNYQFNYDLDSVKNIYQQGYEYLKTLPEFVEAIDEITEEQATQLSAVKNVKLYIKQIIL